MDVIIRVIATGEVLDLFPNFALEDKITSAFLTTEGSRAIPVSFPITSTNTRIFGYSERMDRVNKPNTEIPVIVSKISYSRKAVLNLNSSYNADSGYSASIVYNEAILYNQQSTLKLTQLPNLPFVESSVDALIEEMRGLLSTDDLNNELTAFQVYLKPTGTYKKKLPNSDIELTYETLFALNEWTGTVGNINLLVKEKIDLVKDNKPFSIRAAKGIGLSPFVRGWYVIEKVAEYFGYRMGENPFKTESQLRRLTFLNNTADAIVGGFLDYRQLMPEITVSELFQFLWGKFGAKVFIDGNTNTMHIRLIKDAIRADSTKQLPISGKYDIDHTKPKQLKLTAGKNLDLSSVETDTYEEFCTKYKNTIGEYYDDFLTKGISGVVYNEMRGTFFLSAMDPNDQIGQDLKPISSIHFDWDKKEEGLEYEEISSPDECITMHSSDDGLFPYYALDFALHNSIMEVDRKVQQRDERNRLAVCWDMGEHYDRRADGNHRYRGYKFGSIFPYLPAGYDLYYYMVDREGNRFNYALTYVGKNGLFEHFWKEYDAVLRHSNHVVKGKLNMQPFELESLDLSKKFILDGHPVLLTDYSYITGNIDVEKQEFNAITTGLYHPYDLRTEQAHPNPDRILYKWELHNDKDKKIREGVEKRIKDLKENPEWGPGSYFVGYAEDDNPLDANPPTITDVWFYPPSKKEVENGTRMGITTHKVEMRNKVRVGFQGTSETLLLDDNLPIDYEGFFLGIPR